MIRFIYFDLGNVLLHFDHGIACERLGGLLGQSPAQVRQWVFESDLQWRYERGELTCAQFHEHLCQLSGAAPTLEELSRAASDIFTLHEPMVELVAGLRRAGWPLGILSNTCPAHWNHVYPHGYPELWASFGTWALSFELGLMKPEEQIYVQAARLAGVEPQEIFFVDDRLDNIEGARQAGYDAVPFTTVDNLKQDLQDRGIEW
ncbi:MAG: HAD family hydrolase [Planctomycetota bacterium]